MIFYHPRSSAGEESSQEVDLKDLSPDALVARVGELEDQVESSRRRHQIEMRRGMEAVERLQKQAGAPQCFTPTHNHDDGYDVITHQRVSVLVDVQNMYYAARNLYNSKLEFSKLLNTLVRGRALTRALAYIVERPGMEQEKFVEVLRRNGFEVRKKLLIERSDGSQKGDWDLGIALDAIALADRVDVVILVTGDGDFVALVHYLHSRGLRVEVASFPETTALELIRCCNHYHRLNERVLLPTGQFNLLPGDNSGSESSPSPSRREGGPRPGRSPVDDMELEEQEDEEDDDFNL